MKSISYYIVLLAIRYKGLKKFFSSDPVNFQSLREDDLHTPPKGFLKNQEITQFTVQHSQISIVTPKEPTDFLVIYVHGGAYVYGPVKHHWDAVKQIVKITNCTTWLVDYPKAPESKIDLISINIDAVYTAAIQNYDPKKIILIGDSVGGSLITGLTQRSLKNDVPPAGRLILISPVFDASFSNPEIENLNKLDPILSPPGAKSAKLICSNNKDLEDPKISPLNASFLNFPPTLLFLAENDITYPDQRIAVKKMKASDVDLKVIIGKEMPHIWPLIPFLKEGKIAFQEIIKEIENTISNAG